MLFRSMFISLLYRCLPRPGKDFFPTANQHTREELISQLLSIQGIAEEIFLFAHSMFEVLMLMFSFHELSNKSLSNINQELLKETIKAINEFLKKALMEYQSTTGTPPRPWRMSTSLAKEFLELRTSVTNFLSNGRKSQKRRMR